MTATMKAAAAEMIPMDAFLPRRLWGVLCTLDEVLVLGL